MNNLEDGQEGKLLLQRFAGAKKENTMKSNFPGSRMNGPLCSLFPRDIKINGKAAVSALFNTRYDLFVCFFVYFLV